MSGHGCQIACLRYQAERSQTGRFGEISNFAWIEMKESQDNIRAWASSRDLCRLSFVPRRLHLAVPPQTLLGQPEKIRGKSRGNKPRAGARTSPYWCRWSLTTFLYELEVSVLICAEILVYLKTLTMQYSWLIYLRRSITLAKIQHCNITRPSSAHSAACLTPRDKHAPA